MLLTPNWSTHGHGNHSRANAYWLDFLDAPLVQLLEPMFFEPLEEDKTHAAFESDPKAPTTDSPFVFTLRETLRAARRGGADAGRPVRHRDRAWATRARHHRACT